MRIGHRGAAALAPENTVEAFRAAVTAGVDMVEFDVLDLDDGTLVVAHSRDLHEVSHGAATGTLDGLVLEDLRRLAPAVPTLEEALRYFASEATGTGVLVDLKLRGEAAGVARAVAGAGLGSRTLFSSPRPADLRLLASVAGAEIALTYPDDRHGISRRRWLAPLVRVSLRAMRATAPRRLPPMASRVAAGALSVNHRVVSRALVERAHAHGLSVFTWTVNTRDDLDRVLAAGVDGVVSDDPGLLPPS